MQSTSVIDFTKVKTGTLVTESAHSIKEKCIKPENIRMGILTELYFEDLGNQLFNVWPVIWWEGGMLASITHPQNVELVKNKNPQMRNFYVN